MADPVLLEVIDTRITESWGVHWNEMEVVRDFLQNFFDANEVEDIKIDASGTSVIVSAPATFDYKELVYFGSDKGLDDEAVGNYGEGFKASVLNAMRNFNCHVEMHIKDRILRFYFEEKRIGKTTKRALMCSLFEADAITGSILKLKNCPGTIVHQFKFGMNYFYYENNPLFSEELASTYERDIVIYGSTGTKGYVFYKKLLRAELDEPIIVVCNRKYKSVDAKIAHDRDRKVFTDDVKKMLLKYVFNAVPRNTQIINHLSTYWERGSFLLAVISDSASCRYKIDFPKDYYAKDRKIPDTQYDLIREVSKVEEEFQSSGYRRCPAYMSKLGMKTPSEIAQQRREVAREKITSAYSRAMTTLEEDALKILISCIRKFQRELVAKYSGAKYTIGASDEIIGELRDKRTWQEKTVFLNKEVFLFSFGEGLAVLLHEWGHIYGYDGSRNFTDTLTEFIAQIVANRTMFDKFEEEWIEQIDLIRAERLELNEEYSIYSKLALLTSTQKTTLLKNIPEDELYKLLKKNGLE